MSWTSSTVQTCLAKNAIITNFHGSFVFATAGLCWAYLQNIHHQRILFTSHQNLLLAKKRMINISMVMFGKAFV